jgi:hypothetical protein
MKNGHATVRGLPIVRRQKPYRPMDVAKTMFCIVNLCYRLSARRQGHAENSHSPVKEPSHVTVDKQEPLKAQKVRMPEQCLGHLEVPEGMPRNPGQSVSMIEPNDCPIPRHASF